MGNDPFVYVKPAEEQVQRITEVRERCRELHGLILRSIPNSRERSLAITKLEEVSMWANKAIVFHPMEHAEQAKPDGV